MRLRVGRDECLDDGRRGTLIPHARPPPSATRPLGIAVIRPSFPRSSVPAARRADTPNPRCRGALLATVPVAPVAGAAQLEGGATAPAASSSKLHSPERVGTRQRAETSASSRPRQAAPLRGAIRWQPGRPSHLAPTRASGQPASLATSWPTPPRTRAPVMPVEMGSPETGGDSRGRLHSDERRRGAHGWQGSLRCVPQVGRGCRHRCRRAPLPPGSPVPMSPPGGTGTHEARARAGRWRRWARSAAAGSRSSR